MCTWGRILIILLTIDILVLEITAAQGLSAGKFPRATDLEPKPCKTGVVCDDEDDYPKLAVELMMKQNKNLMASSPNLQHTEDADNSTASVLELCESRGKYIPIRKARNIDGVWRYVLNDGNQYYYVELCRNADTPCNFNDYLPSGYKSVCRQKYVRIRLQAVVGNNIVQDEFPIPSCCYCSITSLSLSKGASARISNNIDSTNNVT